ncbi:MAG: hypothetical protein AB7T31_03305 [Gemmatimonadales bacterium]
MSKSVFSMRVSGLVRVLLVLFCASCSEPNGAVKMAVQDSAGIRVVTTLRTEWEGAVPLEEEPIAVFGLEEPGVAPVGQIEDAVVLKGGAVVLIDRLGANVRRYDAQGQHLGVIGREGVGPGEFTTPRSLQALEDGGFVVHDQTLARASVFDSLGSLLTTVSLKGGPFEVAPADVWYLGPDQVVTWEVEPGYGSVRARTATAERRAIPGNLRFLDLAQGTTRTLLAGTATEVIREAQRISPVMFATRALTDALPGVVVFAEGTSHEVHWVEPILSLHTIVRHPSLNRALERTEIEGLLAERRAMATAAGTTLRNEIIYDPDLQPDIRPAFSRLAVGPDGTVWAKVFQPDRGGESQWWIVTKQGGFRGLVELPYGTDVMDITDEHLLLRRLDQFDVERLELWVIPEQIRQR